MTKEATESILEQYLNEEAISDYENEISVIEEKILKEIDEIFEVLSKED
jgi:hypothetical protein